ncbi:DUF935 domain-containing protein [Leptolyngbyaceae cyanobacterium UHCC 1019]
MLSSSTPPAKPSFPEIATIGEGRDITRESIGLLLEPQDKVLKSKDLNYEVYEDILRDDQVQSCFQQRRTAVISREWEVMPGDDTPQAAEAADFIRATLERINWDSVTEKMLFGVFYGYGVAECLWQPGEKGVDLAAIKVRKARRFKFGSADQLPKLITKEKADGEDLPPAKFWHFCTGADNDDEPYGLGLGHWLYWLVFFKRNGIKSWLKFLQNFAQPTRHGKYQPGATDEEKKRLLQALEAIGEDSGIITPEGIVIELIEASRSGTADYATLHDKMDAAIAKVILSQTMTTDNGSSRSQAQVHEGVKQEVIKTDADLICGSFNNGPVRWLCDWNYPGVAYPKVWRRIEDEPDLLPQAQRDEIITKIGFTPNPQYIQETYGNGFVPPEEDAEQAAVLSGSQMESLLKILAQSSGYSPEKRSAILRLAFPQLPEDQLQLLIAEDPSANAQGQTLTPNPSPVGEGDMTVDLSERGVLGFAEAQRLATVDRFVAQLRERAQPEFEKMTLRLRSALAESTDLVEFREKLDGLYPDLDGDALTQIMAEAMFASKLAGIFEAQEGE